MERRIFFIYKPFLLTSGCFLVSDIIAQYDSPWLGQQKKRVGESNRYHDPPTPKISKITQAIGIPNRQICKKKYLVLMTLSECSKSKKNKDAFVFTIQCTVYTRSSATRLFMRMGRNDRSSSIYGDENVDKFMNCSEEMAKSKFESIYLKY